MNNIMKTLTLFTVLLTLPTLVFSFFGMNVPLPLDEKSYSSWLFIVGISLVLVTIVSIFLWRNKIITANYTKVDILHKSECRLYFVYSAAA